MIDSVTIFTKTGLVLYHNQLSTTTTTTTTKTQSFHTINTLIQTILLDDTRFTPSIQKKKKKRCVTLSTTIIAEWEEDHNREWIGVILYPSVLLQRRGDVHTKWIRLVLRMLLKEFEIFVNAIGGVENVVVFGEEEEERSSQFDGTFRALLKRSESVSRKIDNDDEEEEEEYEEEEDDDDEHDDEDDDDNDEDDEKENLVMRSRRQIEEENKLTTTKRKMKKKKTVWHDGTGKMSRSALNKLDRSKKKNSTTSITTTSAAADHDIMPVADDSRELAEARAAYLPSADEALHWDYDETLILDDTEVMEQQQEEEDSITKAGTWGSSLHNLFQQMSGNKILTKSDLQQPLLDMQSHLTSKNVASDIASDICNQVRDKLVGKRMHSFTRVKTCVRQALEEAVEKILRPSGIDGDVDLLRMVLEKRNKRRGGLLLFAAQEEEEKDPFVIVMVGINGVGKSTSLAKIAYYLKANGCNPLLAACDTFRSGAVEQLNVHAKCLNVPLHHKGYSKDPSTVAQSAIQHAKTNHHDVVLIDTAGRMQNNIPLMKALSKLIIINQPDLVLFVCEALVGNDGMDQLNMFDRALRMGGGSTGGRGGGGRCVDGIVLTKFDTVSDKVGAVLTLTNVTGAPVVFVGTGQKYHHLKKLGVRQVIKSLFS